MAADDAVVRSSEVRAWCGEGGGLLVVVVVVVVVAVAVVVAASRMARKGTEKHRNLCPQHQLSA